MRKKMAAVFIMLMMSFTAVNASAKMGGSKGMMGSKDTDMAGQFMNMVAMLELSVEQQKAVEAIHFTHRKEVIRKTADIDVAEVELQEIMGKEPVNMADAEKKIRAIATLQADLDVMHMKTKAAVKAKLTPEQLKKMDKHMAAGMKEKMESMGGMGMGCDKMDCKSKKCAMMGSDPGGAKASAADAAVSEDKPEPSHQH